MKYCSKATQKEAGVWCDKKEIYVSVLNCNKCLKNNSQNKKIEKKGLEKYYIST